MKTILLIVCALTIGCGSAKDSEPSAPPPNTAAPAQSKILCGDTLVMTSGFTFLVNVVTLEITYLPDGTYGFDEWRNGWGSVTPACHYLVVGESATLKLPLPPSN